MTEAKRPGLVIFDCDGVLVDSEPVANAILGDELRRIGLRMTDEQVIDAFVGLTMSRCLELIAERLGRPVPDGFVERVQLRTFAAFREQLRPVRGVAEAIDRVSVHACAICVASSGEHDKMRLTLGLTGLWDRFDENVFSATEVSRGKPHPDLFLHAARRMGVEPRHCAVIEDSLPGVRAGRAAGMKVYGYAERSDPQALRNAGAEVFDRMDRLPELLGLDPPPQEDRG